MNKKEIEKIESQLLLSAIRERYGYDFGQYAQASLERRLQHAKDKAKVASLSELIPLVLHDEHAFENFLLSMSVVVTEMFRDPRFFIAFRESVIPILKTYPYIKIWHAGCATGEEVYSTAIMLYEAGFLNRTQIYATDYNHHAIQHAMRGHYSLSLIEKYEHNYQSAGGNASLYDYFEKHDGYATVPDCIKKSITFSHHNLAVDGVFGEMNVIICRNVMIYFNETLQNRVLELFHDSLCHRGFLCLGDKETLKMTAVEELFEEHSKKEKIYRRL